MAIFWSCSYQFLQKYILIMTRNGTAFIFVIKSFFGTRKKRFSVERVVGKISQDKWRLR